MSSLPQLPNDVLQLVLDAIPQEERRKSLIALSQTCRMYLNLLGPEIYHHVVWRSLFLTTKGIDELNSGLLSPFIKNLTFYALDDSVPSAGKQVPVNRKTHWHPIDFRNLWKKDPEQRNLPDLLARIEDLPNLADVHIDLPLVDLSQVVDSFLHGYNPPEEIQDKEAVHVFAQRLFESLVSRSVASSASNSISRSLRMYGNMKSQLDAFSTPAWRQYLGSLTAFWHDGPAEAEYSLKEVLYDHLTSITSLTIDIANDPVQLYSLLTPTSAPNLKHLTLRGTRYEEYLANVILAHAPHLISLELDKVSDYDYDGSLSICFQQNSMPNLRHLALDNLPIEAITRDFLVSHIKQLETLELQCYCHTRDPTSTASEQVSYTTLFQDLLSQQPHALQKLELVNVTSWPDCWIFNDDHSNMCEFCDACFTWGHTDEDYELRHWLFSYHYPDNECPGDILDDLPEDTVIDWAVTKAAARAFDDARAWVDLRRWLEERGCEVDGPEIGPEWLPWDPAWKHGDEEWRADGDGEAGSDTGVYQESSDEDDGGSD